MVARARGHDSNNRTNLPSESHATGSKKVKRRTVGIPGENNVYREKKRASRLGRIVALISVGIPRLINENRNPPPRPFIILANRQLWSARSADQRTLPSRGSGEPAGEVFPSKTTAPAPPSAFSHRLNPRHRHCFLIAHAEIPVGAFSVVSSGDQWEICSSTVFYLNKEI